MIEITTNGNYIIFNDGTKEITRVKSKVECLKLPNGKYDISIENDGVLFSSKTFEDFGFEDAESFETFIFANSGFNTASGGSEAELLLFQQLSTIVHTGTTDETILYSFEIPANTLSESDIFAIKSIISVTNSVPTKNVKAYLSLTNANLVGAVQIGTRTINTQNSSVFNRELLITTDATFNVMGATENLASDQDTSATANVSFLAIDFTQPVFFILTATLENSANTLRVRRLYAELKKLIA
jgi:hypothetical protein